MVAYSPVYLPHRMFKFLFSRQKNQYMKVTILGAGNVATQLALGLKKAGHDIAQIYNRSSDAGKQLAHTVGASFTSDTGSLRDADIYLVAVKDDVLPGLAASLRLHDKVVAHTSGTQPKELLKPCSKNYGVFYPLQTITKSARLDFKEVPLLIDGNSALTLRQLEALAATLTTNVHKVDDEQRRWIHVAAVFANNFTNHLWALSETILKNKGIDFDILKPLIKKTVANLEYASPSQIQTGPAQRGDHQLVQQHLSMLENDPRLHKLYRVLSESIIKSALEK